MTPDAAAAEQSRPSEVDDLQQRLRALEAELAESENTHRLRHGALLLTQLFLQQRGFHKGHFLQQAQA